MLNLQLCKIIQLIFRQLYVLKLNPNDFPNGGLVMIDNLENNKIPY